MLIGSMDILFIIHGPAFLTNLAVLAFLKVKIIDKTIVYISSEAKFIVAGWGFIFQVHYNSAIFVSEASEIYTHGELSCMPDHGYRKASIKVIPCPSCGGKAKIPKEHLYDLRDFASVFSLKGHESPAKIESMISEVDTLDSVLRIARQRGACSWL